MRSGGAGTGSCPTPADSARDYHDALLVLAPPLRQFQQLQRQVHFTPVKKHSQYFLEQLVFLQLQPRFRANSDCSPPMTSNLLVNALGSFSRTALLAFWRLSQKSRLLRHWQHEHFSPQSASREKHSQYMRRHFDLGHLHETSVFIPTAPTATPTPSMLIFYSPRHMPPYQTIPSVPLPLGRREPYSRSYAQGSSQVRCQNRSRLLNFSRAFAEILDSRLILHIWRGYFWVSGLGWSQQCVPPMLKQDSLDLRLFMETLCPLRELDRFLIDQPPTPESSSMSMQGLQMGSQLRGKVGRVGKGNGEVLYRGGMRWV